MIPINGGLKILVQKEFYYNEAGDRRPVVLDSSCKRDLYRIGEKANIE